MAVQWLPLKSTALLDRLQALLGLQERTDRPSMALWPGVLPVLDLAGLFRVPVLANTTLDLSGAADTYVVAFTVPVGKRWQLVNVTLGPETTSAKPSAYSDGTTVIKLESIGALSGLVTKPTNTWLEAGWTVGALATQQVGHVAITFAVHYLEEDSYGL